MDKEGRSRPVIPIMALTNARSNTIRLKTIKASPVHSRLLLFTLRRIICGSTASIAKTNASAPAHSANSEHATEGRKNLSGPQRNGANENGLPSRRHNQMPGTEQGDSSDL